MRFRNGALCALSVVLLSAPVQAGSCLDADKTGLAWVHPFETALAKAQEGNRLLMIKPVAFGTTPDGGW